MKQESSVINPYNGVFGQQGWICPKCGRVYSPFTQMCLYCKPNNTNTISNLGDHSNTHISEEELKENRKTGYTKRTMLFKLNSISIGKGRPEWGAPDNEAFILKLGNRIIDMGKKIIIASRTHPQYGDVYVGFQNRDELFVKQGFYKMQGNDLEDLSNFIPPACTCIHFADKDVQEYCNK